jgi:acyl carrier protein
MDTLEKELLEMIIDVCRIETPIPEDFDGTEPLIGPDGPLGIDSLDAVEIVFTVQNKYKVRIDSEERSREVLRSINSLADFIRRNTLQANA